MTANRTLLRLERLGGREAPSATAVAVPTGAAGGIYRAAAATDAGRGYLFHGAADLPGQGHFDVAGELKSAGLVRGGHASGLLVLNGRTGLVVLGLTGPDQDGPAALPDTFTYTVIGGSGLYRGLRGTGTLSLTPNALQGRGPQFGAFSIAF